MFYVWTIGSDDRMSEVIIIIINQIFSGILEYVEIREKLADNLKSANMEGKEPRLVISKIVNENFKSYAGRIELGIFHKVRLTQISRYLFYNDSKEFHRHCWA